MRRAIPLVLYAAVVVSCKGSDANVKVTRSDFDPRLGAVPGNVPDKEPARKIGDSYTAYGLWVATQDPRLEAEINGKDVMVRGYIVNVSKPSETRGGVDVTPNVWIADQPSRKGLYYPMTGYADSYTAMEQAAAYDKCIEACSRTKGDPAADAKANPGGFSGIFGECVTDLAECRALYEGNPSANYFKHVGSILKWYVRDQIFVSDKRSQVEEALRGQGNVFCEAGPAQRRLMVTILVASVLGLDIEEFRRDVEAEIKQKYPDQRVEQLEPSVVQEISNRNLTVLDDPENVRKIVETIRAIRAGTDDGSTLGANRELGAAWKAALAKGGSQGAAGVLGDAKKVADDLLADLMYRWFWSKQDAKREANMACVFDDLIDLTSQFGREPIDLITRRRAMLGPAAGVTWEQAMTSNQQYDIMARFTSQSRTGFIGWTLDILETMVCREPSNCPPGISPVFGTVYEFKFGAPPAAATPGGSPVVAPL